MGRISLLRLMFLSLAATVLIIAGCDELVTEVNNITVYDTTMGDECFECHDDNDNLITLPRGQWMNSAHASPELIEAMVTIDNAVFQTNVCGPSCHTNEGFVAFTKGEDTSVTRPTTIGCYTCHMPHSGNYGQWDADTLRNYDSEDFVRMNNGVRRYYIDPESQRPPGRSQMCVHCHQALNPAPIDTTSDSTEYVNTWSDITLTAGWGPHYSPQADVVSATAGFQFGMEWETVPLLHSPSLFSPTDKLHGCLNCHYGTGVGYEFGEHTFKLQDDITNTEYLENCNRCHDPPKSSLLDTWSLTVFTSYVIPLRDSLVSRGWLDADLISIPVGTTIPQRGAQILYNYLLWERDGSYGVHNPKFMDTLMRTSLAAFDSVPPIADFTISDSVGCVGMTVTFTDISVGAVHGLSWIFGDDSTGGNQSTIDHVYNDPGVYTVTLQAFSPADSAGGLDKETKVDLITVVGNPAPKFGVSDTLGNCSVEVTFTDSTDFGHYLASDSGLWTWEWHFGDGTSSTEQNPTHTYLAISDTTWAYTCTLIVSSACGDSTLIKDSCVVVADHPLADFSVNPPVGDTTTLFTFTNLSGCADSYDWNFGDGTTSTLTDPTHQYASDQDTTFTVRLIATKDTAADTAYTDIAIDVP